MIDLRPEHIEAIKAILEKYVPNTEVRAFGSRVTSTAKDHSDLDLAIVAAEKVNPSTLAKLEEAFKDSDLPFRVDVLDWNTISDNFRKIIEEKYEVLQK